MDERLLSPNQLQEYIKLYGGFCEVLEEDAIPVLTKVVIALNQKLEQANADIHEAISHSYSMLVHNTLHTFPDLPSSCNFLKLLLKNLFTLLHSPNQCLQVGAALSLTQVIQHCPLECLKAMASGISDSLLSILRRGDFSAKAALTNSIVTFILSIEHDYAPYAQQSIPLFVSLAQDPDALVRKNAVDTISSMAEFAPEVKAQPTVLAMLQQARLDSVEFVRDAAEAALEVCAQQPPQTLSPQFTPEATAEFQQPVIPPQEEPRWALQAMPPAEQPAEVQKVPSEMQPFETFHPTQLQPLDRRAALLDKLKGLEASHELLKGQFSELSQHTRSDLALIGQRLEALQQMLEGISQLYTAKFQQIVSHPRVAALLG